LVALNAVNVFYLRFQQNFNQGRKKWKLIKIFRIFKADESLQ